MADHAAVANTINLLSRNKVRDASVIVEDQESTTTETPIRLLNFNISGQRFTVSQGLLNKHPNSKLAAFETLKDHWVKDCDAYYFDRDPVLFNAVLNVLRYGVVAVPREHSKDLMLKELNYWKVQCGALLTQNTDSEEENMEKEFLWLENKIPPPSENSNAFLQYRYLFWCFFTDPLGPHTKFRTLSIIYNIITICLMTTYMVLYAVTTSPYFRGSIYEEDYNDTINDVDLKTRLANIGCTSLSRIQCIMNTSPNTWAYRGADGISYFFVAETILRLILCPGWAYFKSVINWIDIFATVCQCVFIWAVAFGNANPDNLSMDFEYFRVVLECTQTLRIFKIMQVR